MVKNFPKIMKNIKCSYPRSSELSKQDTFFKKNRQIYKVVKNKKKQKILKTITEKEYIAYREAKVKLTTDFSSESRRT